MKKFLAQKQNFQNFSPGAYKNRIDNPGQMIWSQLYINILGAHFVNLIPNSNNWDIIYDYL